MMLKAKEETVSRKVLGLSRAWQMPNIISTLWVNILRSRKGHTVCFAAGCAGREDFLHGAV